MDILIEQEIALHQYEVRQSETEVQRLLHHSFIEVGKSGRTFDYESIIKLMKEEKPSDSTIHSQRFQLTQLEPSVQLLCYESAHVDPDGVASHFAKRCSIWCFTGRGWQLKYHQGTVCEPFKLLK